MTTLDTTVTVLAGSEDGSPFDEAQLAAAAFLARYSGRTLDAYRHDLRTFFQWAADVRLGVLDATRPHIELYRAALENQGLTASTIADVELFEDVVPSGYRITYFINDTDPYVAILRVRST